MDILSPVVWVKAKYTAPKQRGRYSGSANYAPPKKRHKNAKAPKPDFQMVMKLDALSGKTTWFKRDK